MLEIIGVAVIGYVAYRVGRRTTGGHGRLDRMGRKDSGEDNFEGWFVEGRDPRPVSANLEIGYCDAKGNVTRRKIHVRQFDPGHGGGMLLAHCHLREESRSFRVDRVKACVDTDTGEVVKDVVAHLEKKHSTSPDRVIEMLARDYRDIVRVLGYVALSDGSFSPEEKQVVSNYLRRLTRDDRCTAGVVALAASTVGNTTLHGFKMAVGRVVNSGGVSPILLAGACREIAEADGSITPGEQAALDYLDRKILSAPS